MPRAALTRRSMGDIPTQAIVETTGRSISPKRLDGWSSRDLVKVVDAYELQMGIIGAQTTKTVFAMRKLLELHQHGAIVTRDLVAYLCYLDLTATHLTGPYRDIFAQAQRDQLVLAIEHIHGALRLGGTRIAEEVYRSLRPIKKPGLMYRLLFGDKDVAPDEQV